MFSSALAIVFANENKSCAADDAATPYKIVQAQKNKTRAQRLYVLPSWYFVPFVF